MTASTEVATVGTLPAKLEYARFLATSGLLPRHYRDNPGNVLFAVEYASMLDLPPMAAITGIHVIDGRPTASAALMTALVRRAGHRLRVSFDPASMTAVAELTRADDPGFTFRASWDLSRALTAGLVQLRDGRPWARDRHGDPLPWERYTQNMLKARAVSEVSRDGAEEALMGMHYTPEELGVEVDDDGAPVRATATVVGTGTPSDPQWASRVATPYERANGHPEPAGQESPDTPLASPDEDWDDLIAAACAARDAEGLRELWERVKSDRPADLDLRARITEAGRQIKAAAKPPSDPVVDGHDVTDEKPDPACAGVTQAQHRHMHALWHAADLTDRDDRLRVTSHLVGRPVTSSAQLTQDEAEEVIRRLRGADTATGALYTQVSRWLADATDASGATPPTPEDDVPEEENL